MSDDDFTRINTAIRNKSQLIINRKIDIYNIQNYIRDVKRQKDKSENNINKIVILKDQMKIAIAEIKKLKKEIYVSRKELKIYEAEYKKKQKDPNYRIDFGLLRQKYNKYNVYM